MAEPEITEETISKSMEVTDKMEFIYKYKTEGLEKTLKYIPNLCTGCGICVDICPVEAIELGPITEIATGEIDAPYILIDQNKCEYCGICTLCPLNAIEFSFDELNIKDSDDYPKFARSHFLDEDKCVKCFLCEETCPREAIEAQITVKKKDELVIYPEGVSFKDLKIEGDIKIDYEKCTYCKLCDKLCDALEIVPGNQSPLNIYAGKRIEIYLSECDYCGLCEKICPVDAIKVNCNTQVEREIKDISVEGKIIVDEEKCIYCNWCGNVCFVDAIKVEKEFEGEITLQRLEFCDPLGCQACIKICPTKSWYIPQEKSEKIAVDEKFCIYCGSCELACPENCIIVDRNVVKYKEFNQNTPWANSWLKALKIIEESKKVEMELKSIPIEQKEEVKKTTKKIEKIPQVAPEIWEKFQAKLNNLNEILGKAPVRYYMEGKKEKKPKILTQN
ncbi:MAG: 4Fe-4S binding protein [Candidatus Helarchaeota archaeon]